VKNKAATDGVEPSTHGGARRYTPETEVNPPPDTTPLVITPFSAAVGQNPAGIFVEN